MRFSSRWFISFLAWKPTLLIILVLFCVLFEVPGCTYGPIEKRVSLTTAPYKTGFGKPHSTLFTILANYSELQWPTGINTFPNGGVPRTVKQKYMLYLCNAETKEAKLLHTFSPSQDKSFLRDSYDVYQYQLSDRWLDDSFFLIERHKLGSRLHGVSDSAPFSETIYRFFLDGSHQVVSQIPDEARKTVRDRWYPPVGKYVRLRITDPDVFVYTQEQTKHLKIPYGYDSTKELSYYSKAFTFDIAKQALIPIPPPSP
ncbi:MAG: hypothetical protein KDD55_04275 [Bdellovibrionales bacterium]|nr:hypothetical protein [Bdellovibrionales bacterium]